jgi:hypothetical protein
VIESISMVVIQAHEGILKRFKVSNRVGNGDCSHGYLYFKNRGSKEGPQTAFLITRFQSRIGSGIAGFKDDVTSCAS